MPIFAAEKKRKDMDIMILGIAGIAMLITGVVLLVKCKRTENPYWPKKKS